MLLWILLTIFSSITLVIGDDFHPTPPMGSMTSLVEHNHAQPTEYPVEPAMLSRRILSGQSPDFLAKSLVIPAIFWSISIGFLFNTEVVLPEK